MFMRLYRELDHSGIDIYLHIVYWLLSYVNFLWLRHMYCKFAEKPNIWGCDTPSHPYSYAPGAMSFDVGDYVSTSPFYFDACSTSRAVQDPPKTHAHLVLMYLQEDLAVISVNVIVLLL